MGRRLHIFHFFLASLFAAQWIFFDSLNERITASGLSSPWYPQAALSLALVTVLGERWLWLVFASKLLSSVIVWPGPLIERIFPSFVFMLGIGLMSRCIRDLEKKRFTLVNGAKAVLSVAAIGLPMSGIRQVYYYWLGSADTSWSRVFLENWLGDTTTILCLSPGLVFFFRVPLRESLAILRKILREYWLLLVLVPVLAICLSLASADLSYRIWYLTVFPCLGVAAFAGLEGAILITFFSSLLLAFVATAFLPRVYVSELQVFLLSANLIALILGAMVSENRRRLKDASAAALQAMETQLVKIRVLMKMRKTMLDPLRALIGEAERGEAANLLPSARELLRRLDEFGKQLEADSPPLTCSGFKGKDLLSDLRSIYDETSPPQRPEFAIKTPGPDLVYCDRAQTGEIFRRLLSFMAQVQNPQGRRGKLTVEFLPGKLYFHGELPSFTSTFSPQEMRFSGHLPAGGYALTAFILHSLVRNLGGHFKIYPDHLRFQDTLIMEITVPLGQGEGGLP